MTDETTHLPGRRPPNVTPPAHLSKSPPVPEPRASDEAPDPDRLLAPTRYGDWERNGIAIDF
ncbi:DUF1674 domain-containing protein [Sphingomonas sp. BIUV-7]|uniref:DUF1674 domain-containing protein n=1 Tax=Sphingomonas natans TaxID=3063330 RepID=A0ABT8YE18_9SPHN|nr:DUF1674 domain-containing protein [Sphingomonas sp. BIUV-7]MDO6416589.1 DUF1674 domain-containing protein [Sphingomonas sp. BIUV-7]